MIAFHEDANKYLCYIFGDIKEITLIIYLKLMAEYLFMLIWRIKFDNKICSIIYNS